MQPLESIHDVLAVRIIVPTKADCYTAMRHICSRWRPVDGREKNYIRHPKCNGYRSLHNVVLAGGEGGVPIEVQIRTPQMHWEAEFGLAAHWRYKEAAEGGWDMHVAWSRMMLLYAFGLRDYGKKTLSGLSSGSRMLREMTASLMAAREGAGRSRWEARGLSAPPSGAPHSAPCRRRRRWMEHVKREMQPEPLSSILVVVQTQQWAKVHALPATLGASTVAELEACGSLPWVGARQIHVNGRPARDGAHPIYMGDVVTVVPQLVPAVLQNPLNLLSAPFGTESAPLGKLKDLEAMQREVFGVVLGALRGRKGAARERRGMVAASAQPGRGSGDGSRM